MAGPIAKLYATLGLDAREFSEGVASAQSKAGTLSGAVGTGMRVAAGAMAAGLGFAAKGAIEMENRMAQFQADTGASAEEAQRFGDELNAMAGRSLVAMDDIAGAMTAIRTDLGLTGDEASAVAEDFERFMRATGQGSDAVLAFDDILDAWNLDAAKSAEVMDVLVKSHQTYGGSIEENQANLAKLAPALQAANIGFDEGQAFLNLFAASGIDGAAAATAFTKALGEVKSPEELEQMLQTIMDMEDPFQRAQAAAELFGARGGAKIADALANAEGGLDSFKVTAVDAFGATEDAAAALDGTLSSQVQLAINHATSLFRGFGMELGPILTGAASAVNLAAALLPPGALGKAWSTAAGSGLVKGAVAAAGMAAGLAYQAAAFVTEKFVFAVSAIWDIVGAVGGGAVRAAATAGSAAGLGFLAGFAKVVSVVGIGAIIGEAMNEVGLGHEMRDWRQEIEDEVRGLEEDTADLINESATPIGAAVINQITALGPAWDRAVDELERRVEYDPLSSIQVDAFDVVGPIRESFKLATEEVGKGFGAIKEAIANPPQLMSKRDRLENMQTRLRTIVRNMREAVREGDPFNVQYWEDARAKQQRSIDRLRGVHTSSLGDIKSAYDEAGVSVAGTWADATFTMTEAARQAGEAAVAKLRDAKGDIERLDWVSSGVALMDKLGIGMNARAPFVYSVADNIARETQRRLLNPEPVTPKVPAVTAAAVASSDGRGVTVNIHGNVYGGDAGLRDLDRHVRRAVRLAQRNRD